MQHSLVRTIYPFNTIENTFHPFFCHQTWTYQLVDENGYCYEDSNNSELRDSIFSQLNTTELQQYKENAVDEKISSLEN